MNKYTVGLDMWNFTFRLSSGDPKNAEMDEIKATIICMKYHHFKSPTLANNTTRTQRYLMSLISLQNRDERQLSMPSWSISSLGNSSSPSLVTCMRVTRRGTKSTMSLSTNCGKTRPMKILCAAEKRIQCKPRKIQSHS